MVKVNNIAATPLPVWYGESTETKPTTDVEYASKFIEIDSGKEYYFNGTAWVQWIPYYRVQS